MQIHKEGYKILLFLFVGLIILNTVVFVLLPEAQGVKITSVIISCIIFLLILQFFRSPNRVHVIDDRYIVAPADGTVVVIEEVIETEYFKDARKQISIFMSPFNVHINRNPISGVVTYFKYHAGKYLVAWHPKSSTENERTTLVIKGKNNQSILFRQIAGALAKRIIWYVKEGEMVKQCDEFGFIKFGSRVDVFIPLNAKVNVKIGEKTKGGVTVIAEFAE